MANENLLVSVLIPAYNRENTILRTLQSVLDQTYSNIEIVVVDDGSTDNTLAVTNGFFEKFNINGKVIHQENKGVAAARNVAIDNCTGDYLVPLDSDDFLEKEVIEKAILKTQKFNNADICFWGYNSVKIDGKYINNYSDDGYIFIENFASGIDVACKKLNRDLWICHGVAMYRTQMVNEKNIRYIAGLNHGDDLYFIMTSLMEASCVVSIDFMGTNISTDNSSLMHSKYSDSFWQTVQAGFNLKNKAEKMIFNEDKNKKLLSLIDNEIVNQYLYVVKKIVTSFNLLQYKQIKLILNNHTEEFARVSGINKDNLKPKVRFQFNLLGKSYFLFVLIVKFQRVCKRLKSR